MSVICDTCKYSDSCSAKNDITATITQSYIFRDTLNHISDTYPFIKTPAQITIECERYIENPLTVCDQCIHKKVCKFTDRNPGYCYYKRLAKDDKT